jgi:Nucleotidyl transferase AbiEii toxin, Type IV TA system
MNKRFVELPREARLEFIIEAGRALKAEAAVLEKDIWVCWALEVLFKLELPMVFKGGTSLSKVYRAIARFSEDLDITIDHVASGDSIEDPLAVTVSNTKRREFSERMKTFMNAQVLNVIKPHFEAHLQGLPHLKLSLVESGDQLLLEYENVITNSYILPQIKLEFGARNAVEPSAVHVIEPDVMAWEVSKQLEFPSAKVPVLLAERTYWEKVTLIHAEITRKNPKLNMERYSRHWYDLAQLAQHDSGARALKRVDLRDHVIRTKTALFGVAGVNYDLVANGNCQLIPSDALHDALEQDYLSMVEAGMFDGIPPTWAALLEVLRELEGQINTAL